MITSRCFRTCRGERASQRAGDCGRVEFKPDSLLAHDRWVPRVAQHLADNVHEAFRGAIGAAEGSSRVLLLMYWFMRTRRTPLRRSGGLPRESSASRFSPPLRPLQFGNTKYGYNPPSTSMPPSRNECEPTFHRCRPCSSCKIDNIDVFKNATSFCRA